MSVISYLGLYLYYGNKLPCCVMSFCLKMNKSTFNHTNENQDDSLSSKREHAAIVFSLKNEVSHLIKALKIFQVSFFFLLFVLYIVDGVVPLFYVSFAWKREYSVPLENIYLFIHTHNYLLE